MYTKKEKPINKNRSVANSVENNKGAEILSFHRNIQKKSANHSFKQVKDNKISGIIQLLPDKNTLYWRRLREKAGNPVGIPLVQHLATYIINPVNINNVGANVAAQVNAAVGAAGGVALITMFNLRNAVNAGIAVHAAAPGQYAADTAFNAALTHELEANQFIQDVMDGTIHDQVSGWRRTAPGAGAIPAPGAGADDRVLETMDLFNRLTAIPGGLPGININPIWGPHAAMNNQGTLHLGWAAARGNILHEFGHHLENNLSPADFTTVHNFLSARTRVPAGGLGAGPMAGMRDAGYFFEHHPGYDIDMPEINAGGLAGRRAPQNNWQRFKRFIKKPFNALGQVSRRAFQSTPLRYLGLIGSGLTQQLGRLLSWVTRRREPRNWLSSGVEDFFVYNANNTQLSYSTAVHNFPNGGGSTEYLSTTVEFFNRPSHARELVRVDPLRAALFLYLANRAEYNNVRNAFNAANAPTDLDDLIHAIR